MNPAFFAGLSENDFTFDVSIDKMLVSNRVFRRLFYVSDWSGALAACSASFHVSCWDAG